MLDTVSSSLCKLHSRKRGFRINLGFPAFRLVFSTIVFLVPGHNNALRRHTHGVNMRSPPPVPPKDLPKIPITTKGPPKRDDPRNWEKIPGATNTSSSKDLAQHMSYAELTRDHILPEVVFGLDKNATYSSQKIPCATEKSANRPLSQTYPEVSYSEFTPNGYLPQTHELENYPQVYNENAPEALNRDRSSPYAPESTDQIKPTRKICGLRRLWFWVLLVSITLIAVVVAIIGGVLGSRAGKTKSKTTILPTAALAAINYTEGNGVQHYRVYFQAKSNALYQSAWNSSAQEWHVLPLNPRGASGPDVKPGTPLAAYTLNDGIHVSMLTLVPLVNAEKFLYPERNRVSPFLPRHGKPNLGARVL